MTIGIVTVIGGENVGRYRGNRKISLIEPEDEVSHLWVQVAPRQITLFNKLLEGYDHLTFVVPIEPKEGLLLLHTTASLWPQLVEIIKTLPLDVTIVKKPSS